MSFKLAFLVILIGICSSLGAYVQPTIWPQVGKIALSFNAPEADFVIALSAYHFTFVPKSPSLL